MCYLLCTQYRLLRYVPNVISITGKKSTEEQIQAGRVLPGKWEEWIEEEVEEAESEENVIGESRILRRHQCYTFDLSQRPALKNNPIICCNRGKYIL